MKQIKKDAYFLAKLNIMDYSANWRHDQGIREVNGFAPISHPMDLTSTSVAVTGVTDATDTIAAAAAILLSFLATTKLTKT